MRTEHVLLYLAKVLFRRTILHHLTHTIIDDFRHRLALLGCCREYNLHVSNLLGIVLDTGIDRHTVCTAAILANCLCVEHRHCLLEHIDKDVVLQRLLDGSVIKEDVQGVGGILLLGEVALAFALVHALVNSLVLLFLPLCRQCAEVLCQQGSYRVGIDITHHIELEIFGISIAFAVDFQQTVVVDAIEVGLLHAQRTDIIIIYYADYTVLKSNLRVEFLVLQGIACAFYLRSESIIIATRRSEAKISELEHRLQILLHTVAADVFSTGIDV